MINISGGKDFEGKKEAEDNEKKFPKTTYSSRQWAGFKNPRIVRVSRAFGGKDRHSKVCTVKGLRDRRIRLSVPTAIQLYDLQDRLGVNQPSKVIDWLIENTKEDIDKLPPLQMPIGDFSQLYPSNSIHQDMNSHQRSISPFFNSMAFNQKMKGKEVESDEQQNEGGSVGLNFLPLTQPFFQGFPNNPYCNWEPPNLSLSQFGNQGISSQDNAHNVHSLSLLPSLALPSPSPYFFPAFPSSMTNLGDADSRQANQFQVLSSNSQHLMPISPSPYSHMIDSHALNVNSKAHSQTNDDSQQNKGKSGPAAQYFLS